MEKTKYGKYFISGFGEPGYDIPWGRTLKPEDETSLLRIDAEVFKGINFFARCSWFWPSIVDNTLENRSTTPHSHTYDEIIGMVGTNPDDPTDLCGEIEIIMDGESHIITKSSMVYIPAGLEHGPFRELKVDRPIFQFEFGLNGIHD